MIASTRAGVATTLRWYRSIFRAPFREGTCAHRRGGQVRFLNGGYKTGIPRALVVEEPYDSLSFVPTVLALTGNLRDDNYPISVLWDKGFRRFPGRPVKEVLAQPETQKAAATGATTSP